MDKGSPVPGTGRKSPAALRARAHSKTGGGVSAGSRVLRHLYADEGEKGRWVRRLVRARERALWKKEN